MLKTGTAKRSFGMSAYDLQQIKLPALSFAIPGLVPEGLNLIAGKPKAGKSYLVLDWCLAVAYGGTACSSVECESGDVFYAALEDNPRRMQRRLQQMLPDTTWPHRLCLNHDLPRTHKGGLETLRDWAGSVMHPRLIAIDTLACIRPPRERNENIYDADYKVLEPLRRLASELKLAVVVVHHQRKLDGEDPLDTVSGTLGLTGAADNVLILERTASGTTLHGRGRDVEELERAMQFDKVAGRWSILGNPSEVRRSDERKRIIEALKDGELSVSQLVGITRMKRNNVDALLLKMVKAGEVVRGQSKGRYKLP